MKFCKLKLTFNTTRFTLISHYSRMHSLQANKIVCATHLWVWYDAANKHVQQTCSSLLTFKYEITLQASMFITSNECIVHRYSPSNMRLHCRQACLSLAMNAFCAGDNHFWHWTQHVSCWRCTLWCWRQVHWNTYSNFSHIHTATCSYQQLPSKTHVDVTFKNGPYHAVEIETVFRCTMTSSVTLNCFSRPRKKKTIVELVLTHSLLLANSL